MIKTYNHGALCAIAVILLAGSNAEAQSAAPAAAPTPPAKPAAPTAPSSPAAAVAAVSPPPPSRGPLVAGVCLLSHEALVTRSKVGQGVIARLRDLENQIRTNINSENTRLDARIKALEEKRATLPPLQVQTQGQALMQRRQALQAQAQERGQQFDATKAKAINSVVEAAQPFVDQAYATHGCGLLFARETVFSGNFGNDLTDEVVAAFDAKGAPITFDLEPPRPAH